MSKVVFALTAAQVKYLRQVADGDGDYIYSDYGACAGMVERGWMKKKNWRTYSLTTFGRQVLSLAVRLQLPGAAATKSKK